MDFYVPKRRIRRVPDESGGDPLFTILLDQEEEATSLETAHEARLEVDMLAFTRAIGFDLRSTVEEVDEAAAQRAFEIAQRFFRTEQVRKNLKKGFDLLTAPEEDRRWMIARDGQTIKMMPSTARSSKSYEVRDTCTCPDVWARRDKHGGMCKHLALRALFVLAQLGEDALDEVDAALDAADARSFDAPALAPEPAPEADAPALLPDEPVVPMEQPVSEEASDNLEAAITATTQQIAAAMFYIAMSDEGVGVVDIAARDGVLTIAPRPANGRPPNAVRLTGLRSDDIGVVSDGDARLVLDSDTFDEVWEQLWQAARQQPDTLLNVFITGREIVFTGGDCMIQVPALEMAAQMN